MTEERILGRCSSIENGHTVGYRSSHIQRKRPTLLYYEDPWIIAFNPKTRRILRIAHGRRDLAKLLR